MTYLDPAAHAIVRLAENWAVNYTRAKAVMRNTIRTLDWHPPSTLSDGLPRGNSDTSPVEHAVLGMDDIETEWAQVEDDRTTLAQLLHSSNEVAKRVEEIARRERPDKVEVVRCNGKIDEQCTDAASDHRDHVGTVVVGMCDTCFMRACRGCYEREGTTRRQISIDGRHVPGCDACYRRELRKAGRA